MTLIPPYKAEAEEDTDPAKPSVKPPSRPPGTQSDLDRAVWRETAKRVTAIEERLARIEQALEILLARSEKA